MSKITVERLDYLPRLAWCAQISRESHEAVALIGPWVESRPGMIFEGVWPGSFERGDFPDSTAFFGTGLITRGDDYVFVGPWHTYEAIYSVELEDSLYFSNSIAFLLKESGSSLSPSYLEYEADAMSFYDGIHRYRDKWPLAENRTMNVYYYRDITVRRGGEVIVELKPTTQPSAFGNFDEYHSFLRNQTALFVENANDPSRRVQYPPIVFCSNGYDSTLCAVLGQEAGCTEAVVVESKKRERNDSGIDVVSELGYPKIYEKDEIEYRQAELDPLFLASAELGTSIFFATAAKEISGKLLISGRHGDKPWTKDETPDPELRNLSYPDNAKLEFRLVFGYLVYAPAFLAVQDLTDIIKISNSPELAKWSIGGHYDRPIPRRIAEDAGVSRSSFGLIKDGGAASSLRFGGLGYLKKIMSPESYARFASYYRANQTNSRWVSLPYLKRAAVYSAYLGLTAVSLRTKSPHVKRLRAKWPIRETCSPFAPAHLFRWACDEVQKAWYTDPTNDNSGPDSPTRTAIGREAVYRLTEIRVDSGEAKNA